MIERIKRNSEKLHGILEAVELLDESDLNNLYESHNKHVEALRLAGELMSDALFLKDTAYNERKRIEAETMLNKEYRNNTIKEREAIAELESEEQREQEAQGNYTYTRYKALHQSIDHKLFDIKAKRAAMERELAR